MENNDLAKPKIVMLVGSPLTSLNYDRMGIELLAQKFRVICFDCSEWVGRFSDQEIGSFRNTIVQKVRSDKNFSELLNLYNPNYAIDFVGMTANTPRIGKLLKKHKVKFVIQVLGNLPSPKTSKWKSVIKFFHMKKTREHYHDSRINTMNSTGRISLEELLAKLFSKMKYWLLPYKLRLNTSYIALIAGNNSINALTRLANKKIWVGAYDYYKYNKQSDDCSEISELNNQKYVVFVDECLVGALDWKVLGLQAPVTFDSYFTSLNLYFTRLEDKYSLRVIIAGHPNSESDTKYANNFQGRKILYNKTIELVKNSSAVLLHASTAVSFAVLAKKPVISLLTNELQNSYYGNFIKCISREIGSETVNIDSNELKLTIPKNFDQTKYDKYESNYLKNNLASTDAPWEVLATYLLKDFSIEE